MAEQFEVVHIQDNFYRDQINKVFYILISFIIGVVLLLAISLYLYFDQPPTVYFVVDNEWRIQPDIPVNQPYLSNADLLQWVTDAIPSSFIFDFVNYNTQLQTASAFFTTNGWKVFLNQLNIYANYNNVQTNKLFVNGVPTGAPEIINSGLLSGRYVWWVQMPIAIYYQGYQPLPGKLLTLQVLVVRVPTLNNLNGVGIENVIVAKSRTASNF